MAAICLSPVVLAKAGVLRGKKSTVFETAETVRALRDGGAEYVKTDVVVDGRIITSPGPEAVASFARRIVEALSG